MVDVAALMAAPEYSGVMERIWDDVSGSKMYLTGGLGALRQGEAFGEAFELPNELAYAETCAAIGSVMWNHRMFLLTAESKYYDVLEQTLYNGLLSGVSLNGDEYFYTNPLESDGITLFNHGSATRQPWFDVSCCPTNLCRFLPSIPGYGYAVKDTTIFANLFFSCEADLSLEGDRVRIVQETDYPWNGTIRLTIRQATRKQFRLLLRVPGWCHDTILGAGLYRFEKPAYGLPGLFINKEACGLEIDKGYAVLDREWDDGDVVELRLPMPIRKVLCDARVVENEGKAAIQRGPLVYCVEGRDAACPLDSLVLGPETALEPVWMPDLLGGIMAIEGGDFTAVPYYAWSNRGTGTMKVWIHNQIG